jgi:hypothetical protein
MKKLKYLMFFLIIFLNVISSFGQNQTTNFTDINGLKQGEWIYYKIDTLYIFEVFITNDNDTRKIKIDTTISLKGFYVDNLKEGEWISYNLKNQYNKLVNKSTITFKNNKPTGEFSYFDNGKIIPKF